MKVVIEVEVGSPTVQTWSDVRRVVLEGLLSRQERYKFSHVGKSPKLVLSAGTLTIGHISVKEE